MRYLILASLAGSIWVTVTHAQSKKDFYEGYIVTNGNDTVIGYIKKYEEDEAEKQYSKIVFYNDSIKKEKKYKAKDLKGYSLDGYVYVSKETIDPVYPLVNSRMFMKRMVEGRATLYYCEEAWSNPGSWTGASGVTYMGGSGYGTKKEYYLEKDKIYFKIDKDKLYKLQMQKVLGDCPSIDITDKFAPGDMIRLIVSYNDCFE